MEPRFRILLALDGESPASHLLAYAMDLAGALGAAVTAVAVADPCLREYATELYAQGRREYLEHLETELAQECRHVLAEAREEGRRRGVPVDLLCLRGDPPLEVSREAARGSYDLVVAATRFPSWRTRLAFPDLGRRLAKVASLPLLLVPETSPPSRPRPSARGSHLKY